jgi:hypothetical protein
VTLLTEALDSVYIHAADGYRYEFPLIFEQFDEYGEFMFPDTEWKFYVLP